MFYVLMGGSNAKHPPSFFMSRPRGLNHYLFLLVKVNAQFTVDNRTFAVNPNSAIIIDRNTPYEYSNPNGYYIDDWIHFDTTCEYEFRSSGIAFNEAYPISNPSILTSYLQQIMWEQNYTSPRFKAANIDMLLHILMNKLILAYEEKDRVRQYNPYHTKLQKLRLSLLSAPYKKSTPAAAADSLGISISYFQHLYKDFFGISFQTDLINMRIEYAKELITTTNLSIEQISQHCGYSNEVHFYRQFHKKTGMTPLAYRSMRQGN